MKFSTVATAAKRKAADALIIPCWKGGKLAVTDKEAPRATGLARNGTIIEIFHTQDGLTWSIVNTKPSGCSKMIASGETWMLLPVPVMGPSS